MDSFEASSIVFSRIRKLEPENVTNKIVGYLLLQDRGQEMIRLAFGPDNLIHSLIQRVKVQLGLTPKPIVSPPISPSMNPPPVTDFPFTPYLPTGSSPVALRLPNPCWDAQLTQQPIYNPHFVPVDYSDSVPDNLRLENQNQFVGLEDQLEALSLGNLGFSGDYHYPEATCMRSQRSHSPSELPIKTCHYFNKGYCKHGSNCRYFHGQLFPESFSLMFSPSSYEVGSEEQVFSPGSLQKLELEITELLKTKRGSPISIASLPMLYYEKYGRTLQAEGYLTESQRHGKAGYSLTKLLARLKGSIRLIDRPHGQHSVILVDDALKYMENRSERNDPGPIVSGSRQIYLTFPAESTFTEEDVSDYFNTFGPVQDVRIPCQQKRMFGFVTFVSADTVKMILAKGNPHYVCDARVLVKPYREKTKVLERKYHEKLEPPAYCNSHLTDIDSDLHTTGWRFSRLLRKQFMEQEEAFEVEKHLAELHLVQKPPNQANLGYSMDEQKASKAFPGRSIFPPAKHFNYLLDVLSNGSTSDDNPKHNGTDQESQGLDLPDSPFSYPIESSISTVT